MVKLLKLSKKSQILEKSDLLFMKFFSNQRKTFT